MHIGVDLDNTLVDTTTAYLGIYNRLSGHAKTAADLNDYHLWRVFGWTPEAPCFVWVSSQEMPSGVRRGLAPGRWACKHE